MKASKSGFTLIELLIVIAIILILIAIALPNFLEAQIRAKVAKAAGEIRSLATAQESYNLDWRTYTYDCHDENTTLPSIPNLPSGCVQLTTPIAYIKELPQDPFGVHVGTGSGGGSGGNPVNEGFITFYAMATGVNIRTFQKMTPITPPFNDATPPFREIYVIYSAGPSKIEPGNPQREFPHENASVPWTVYAATNGTKSFGGIMTSGGPRIIGVFGYEQLNNDAHL